MTLISLDEGAKLIGLHRIAENDAAAAEEGEGSDTPDAGAPSDNADGTSEA